MKFKDLSKILSELESNSKRLKKTSILYEFFDSKEFKELDDKTREHIFLTFRGKIFNEWNDKQTGISDALMIKSLNKATGYSEKRIKKELAQTGDLGEVSKNIYSSKKQSVLFSNKINVENIFKQINRLANVSGNKSREIKINIITKLLNSVNPDDTKYIVRILLENIRAGVGSSTIRDALVWTFFPKIYPLFKYCNKCSKFIYNNDEKCISCDNQNIEELNNDIEEIENLESYKKILKKGNFKDKKITLKDNSSREAYNIAIDIVEDAYSVLNSFNDVYKILNENSEKIFDVSLILGRPLRSMLFKKAEDIKDAFDSVGKPAAVEFKYDGFRYQLHYNKEDNLKKIFTRGLDDVTKQFPEIDKLISQIKADSIVLDGEIVSYDFDKNIYLPFQTISQRIIRKYKIHKMAKYFPIKFVIFDILHYNGKDTINYPYKKRRELIEKVISENEKVMLSEKIVTKNIKEANEFYKKAKSKGTEGVMFKNINAEYKPGSRVGYGMKLKESLEPLDLVILKADWGRGKRGKWLTSYTVGCKHNNDFLEVGKVSTGLKELETSGFSFKEMTKLLKKHKKGEDGNTMLLEPNVVIEVAYEEIQKSPNYNSGYALRFPRFLSLREKKLNEIDTLENVKRIYNSQ